MNQITEDTFEKTLRASSASSVLDLRATSFIDPFGMIGILAIGQVLSKKGTKKKLSLPASQEILQCLDRMDFFRYADQVFTLDPPDSHFSTNPSASDESDILLRITLIEKSDDIDLAAARISEQAQRILSARLHYNEKAIKGFSVGFTEICRNIVRHSEGIGYAGIRVDKTRSMGKNVLKVALMDTGIGFTKTLMNRFLIRNDLHALEMALLQGVSRFAEKGRGEGLDLLRNFVNKMNGRLSVRSGTAKLSIIPKWSRGKEKEFNLAPFPGSQISIILPEMP